MSASVTFFADDDCVVAVYCATDHALQLLRSVYGDPAEPVVQRLAGPRSDVMSAWSSNVLRVLSDCGAEDSHVRVVRYRRVRPNDPVDEVTEVTFDWLADGRPPKERAVLADGPVDDIAAYNAAHVLGMAPDEVAHYRRVFGALGRSPTTAELYDLASSNSEHSRHHLFRGMLVDPSGQEECLMDLVRATLRDSPEFSVVALSDNASAVLGCPVARLQPAYPADAGPWRARRALWHPTLTAETHNFPTGVAPFEGAATGTGGRIRDTQCIGRGGRPLFAACGYSVAHFAPSCDRTRLEHCTRAVFLHSPIQILLAASDGASDYGNKMGEPVLHGYVRALTAGDLSYVKPIMFSSGVGLVRNGLHQKQPAAPGMRVVRVGGPTFRLGVGGGSASSGADGSATDLHRLRCAVQRGDPQTENCLDRWLRACCLVEDSPIVSIHDQGAGGMANVTRELVHPVGAAIDLRAVWSGDATLTDAELWVAEAQEQNSALVRSTSLPLVNRIARRERVELRDVGVVVRSGRIAVTGRDGKPCVDLPFDDTTLPRRTYYVRYPDLPLESPPPRVTADAVFAALRSPTVGSKRFLTSKVDRSVGGLVVQQQCVGPTAAPIADVAVSLMSFSEPVGVASAIGEAAYTGCCSIARVVRLAVLEMLTNLLPAPIRSRATAEVRCSANWMWPAGTPERNGMLLQAARELSVLLRAMGVAIDGGKDSLSMRAPDREGKLVDSPPTLVLTAYAVCPDVDLVAPPCFQEPGNSVWYVDMDAMPATQVSEAWSLLQQRIAAREIVAVHDVSDGGTIACVAEMCFGSDVAWCGFRSGSDEPWFLDRRPGVCFECAGDPGLPFARHVGHVTDDALCCFGSFRVTTRTLRAAWELPADLLERERIPTNLVDQERDVIDRGQQNLARVWSPATYIDACLSPAPCAAVLRAPGSNGETEMAGALAAAGFDPWDVTTSDLCDGRMPTLGGFQLLVLVGGFSYGDVLGAGRGWAAVLERNPHAARLLAEFRARPGTLVLGVCNGCQTLGHLGWVDGAQFAMRRNVSTRFESRWVTVRFAGAGPWFANGLHDALFGVWVAHAEGLFPSDVPGTAAFHYVDPWLGQPTQKYPLNPNGSSNGLAGITSSDGRVLAMMPHPERSWLARQCPWIPERKRYSTYTPWLTLFQNARQWCCLIRDAL